MLITGFLFLYASENILNVVSMVFITGLALLQTWLTYKQLIETDLDNAWFGLTVTRRSLKFYKMSQRFRFTSKIPASIPRAAA